jgi:hypothetical protein
MEIALPKGANTGKNIRPVCFHFALQTGKEFWYKPKRILMSTICNNNALDQLDGHHDRQMPVVFRIAEYARGLRRHALLWGGNRESSSPD